jgi:hypothetical protein
MIQAILFSEDGNILEKKYLSSYEDVEINCTLELEGYLVEVGEPKVFQTDSESCMTNSNGSASVLESRGTHTEFPGTQLKSLEVNLSSYLLPEMRSFLCILKLILFFLYIIKIIGIDSVN